MEQPRLLQSRFGKPQLFHNGFTLGKSEQLKNNVISLRCVHRTGSVRCKAKAVVVGELEEGKFEIKFHRQEKHDHEPNYIQGDVHLKNFNSEFKAKCATEIDTPVPKIFEDLKVTFVGKLSRQDGASFLAGLPSRKGHLMQGYRARGAEYDILPKTLDDIKLPENLLNTMDEQSLYHGKTESDTHLVPDTDSEDSYEFSTESDHFNAAKFLHESRAHAPELSTESGYFIAAKPLHDSQAHAPIYINVGGTMYCTSEKTLNKFPASKLCKMLNGKSTSQIFYNAVENQYFIDRDGKVFRYILNFSRYKETILPDNSTDLKLLREDAVYFKIQPLKAAVESKMKQLGLHLHQ